MFGKKKFEDTDAYRDLMKHQEEVERRNDSARKENYRQLNESMKTEFNRELDSLKRSTDSLEKELEKSIQKLKNNK